MNLYTQAGPIVRGGCWPPGDRALRIVLTRDEAWDAGAGDWTWELLFSRTQRGGIPDLTIEADSAVVADKVLTLLFHCTPEDTAGLPGHRATVVYMELRGDDGSPEGAGVSYYPTVSRQINVRSAAGED
jgi:hypothetical protein